MAFEMIFGLLGLAIPLLIISGIVYFILKLRGTSSIRFSYQDALRVYFYAMLLVSVGLMTLGGMSALIKVGFGEIVGPEFSYGEVYEDHLSIQARQERPVDELNPTMSE